MSNIKIRNKNIEQTKTISFLVMNKTCTIHNDFLQFKEIIFFYWTSDSNCHRTVRKEQKDKQKVTKSISLIHFHFIAAKAKNVLIFFDWMKIGEREKMMTNNNNYGKNRKSCAWNDIYESVSSKRHNIISLFTLLLILSLNIKKKLSRKCNNESSMDTSFEKLFISSFI